VRIVLPRAVEPNGDEPVEAVVGRLETRMLACEDQERRETARRKRSCNGRELDRFGPGADDKRNAGRQLSP
jgi:hypothetical protein